MAANYRAGINPECNGGSVPMAAALAAINRGVSVHMPIDVVLKTRQWSSWHGFNCSRQARLTFGAGGPRTKALTLWPKFSYQH